MAAILAVINLASCKTGGEQQTEGPGNAQALPVDIRIATAADLSENETISGSTAANREVVITSQIAQKVISVNFQDGSSVTKGQLLYKLDDQDLKARLNRVEAELNLARLTEERHARLLTAEAIKQQVYDDTKTKLSVATAEKLLLLSELDKTEVRAPFSGQIGISKVHTGAYITPGMPLANLVDLSAIKVTFSISEKEMPYIKTGSQITYVTTISTEEHHAVVSAIESSADPQNRTILVQAIDTKTQTSLKGGLSARISYRKSTSNSTYKIPTEAIIATENGSSVLISQNQTAHLVPIKIAVKDEQYAYVVEGLNNGDSVIVSNLMKAGEGVPVKIITIN